MGRASKLFSAIVIALFAMNADARASFVYQTINDGFTPGNYYWLPNDTGWYWTPTATVDLVGIQTKLATSSNINNNFTFTTTVYTDRPAVGGTGLDSFTWNGATFVDGPWLGGSFSTPLHLIGGTTYFLGFSGWAAAVNGGGGAGVMMVGDTPYMSGTATPGTTLLAGYLSTTSAGLFDFAYGPGAWPDTPILRFIAADPVTSSSTPEPASLVLFGLGSIGAAGVARRRRTAA